MTQPFDCLTYTETCPVRDLTASSIRGISAFAGDSIKYETLIQSNVIGGSKIVIHGTLSFSVSTIGLVQHLTTKSLVVNGISYPFASTLPQSITNNSNHVVEFIAQVPKEQCSNDADSSMITLDVTWASNNSTTSLSFANEYPSSLCELVKCSCNLDIVLGGEDDTLTVVEDDNGTLSALISKEVFVGTINDNSEVSPADPVTYSSKYGVTGTPLDDSYCGPKFVSRETVATLSVTSVLPTATIEIINNIDINDNWSAYVEGESISSECGNIIKYVVDMVNEQEIVECPTLKITPSLTGPLPVYTKAFKLHLYKNGNTLLREIPVTFPTEPIILNDVEIVEGDAIHIKYVWFKGFFNADENDYTSSETSVSIITSPFIVPAPLVKRHTTTSLKVDLVHGEVIYPKCNGRKECNTFINGNSGLTFMNDETTTLSCEDSLSFLTALSSTGVPNFSKYTEVQGSSYTNAKLVYFVKAEKGAGEVSNYFQINNTTGKSQYMPDKTIPVSNYVYETSVLA